MAASPATANRQTEGTLLCLAALFERLAHFVVISLLALHLNERRGYSEPDALSICGLYGAAVYVSAIVGGWASDRSGNPRRATQLGALLLCVGYVVLAQPTLPIVFPLSLLSLGHALYKPSLAVLFGRLRGQSAEARFRLLYLTVNLGATLAPFAAQLALSRGGAMTPFALAAILSVATFGAVASLSRLPESSSQTSEASEQSPNRDHKTPRLSTVLILCLLSLAFFSALAQTEGALIFWARDRTDRSLLGWEIPTLWLTSLPALCLLLVAAPLDRLWTALQTWGRPLTAQNKLRWGLLVTALAFMLFAATARAGEGHGKLAMRNLVFLNLLLAVGELCVAPVAMAIVHSISPGKRQGLGMGLWFLVVALANWLAGQLGRLSTDARAGHSWEAWALLSLGLLFAWLLSVSVWEKLDDKSESAESSQAGT